MEKKRVLIVTQEMKPYLSKTSMSDITNQLPAYLQDQGMEIRVLMPKFGIINERRHRLHEVVRLSGINIIIDEDDHPLMIKVASLPGARLQVYFLDNEDFFKRKGVFKDPKDEKFFEDNGDRMIFFCKGVIETVKKFGWAPDIIHCHGWMTSLIPFYLKTAFKKEPIFKNTKVIYSVYEKTFEAKLNDNFTKKATFKSIKLDLSAFSDATNTNLQLGAVEFADAVVEGNQDIDSLIRKKSNGSGKPYLGYLNGDEYLKAYHNLYQDLMAK